MVDKEKKKKKDKLPKLFFVFDLRGEYQADIANGAIMVKKGDQHDDIMGFASKLGQSESFKFNSIIKDVDLEEAKNLFEEEGYVVTQAEKEDFEELNRELDKLLTIKGGEHLKYD